MFGIEIVRVERRIDLDVGDAVADEPLDFVADDCREIRQERFAILVDAIGDVELEAGRHEVRRRGHGDLEGHAERRGQLQHERQLELGQLPALLQLRADNLRGRLLGAHAGAVPQQADAVGHEAVDRLGHAGQPRSAPQFAVADDVEADVALSCDGHANRLVFDFAQGLEEHQPLGIASPRDHQCRRTQQASGLFSSKAHRV